MNGLWAVHIADGVLQPAWLISGFIMAALLAWWGSWRLAEEEIPRVAVLSSAFFVACTIHVQVPFSVHLLLNGLVGLILGKRSSIAIPLASVLQAMLIGHGGFSTLGINTVIMTLPALGVYYAFRPFRRLDGSSPQLWLIGFVLGFFGVMTTAGLNSLVLWLGGNEDWPTLALAVLLAHVPIAIVEAFIMAATVAFLAKVKPDMLAIGVRNQEASADPFPRQNR